MRLACTHSAALVDSSVIANRSGKKLSRLALSDALHSLHLVFEAQLQFL
jgi:hypothetical protein